jgi:hypothetical protein
MNVEIHAMRFEDDDKLRAQEPTFATKPASIKVDPGQEVVITAKDGVARVTIDGESQGGGMALGRWDYTAVAVTYKED